MAEKRAAKPDSAMLICPRHDGERPQWEVQVKIHNQRNPDGTKKDAAGQFGVAPELDGERIILRTYAACPICGEVGQFDGPTETVFVV